MARRPAPRRTIAARLAAAHEVAVVAELDLTAAAAAVRPRGGQPAHGGGLLSSNALREQSTASGPELESRFAGQFLHSAAPKDLVVGQLSVRHKEGKEEAERNLITSSTAADSHRPLEGTGFLSDFGGGGGGGVGFEECYRDTPPSPATAAAAQEAPLNCTDHYFANLKISETNFADYQQVWYVKDWQEIVFRSSFVLPIVLFGILGNLILIYSMLKFRSFRSKPTNIFILNMAISDLLTTIVCPNAALITSIYQFYVLGPFVCRLEGFIKITCLLVSSYSLIVLSSDWLLCIAQPFRQRMSIKHSWLALALIWLGSILMASPLFVWRSLRERHWKDLVELWCCELIEYTKYYWLGITFFLIYLPTFFMTVVLIIILAQMDKFEAKLRKSRASLGNNLAANRQAAAYLGRPSSSAPSTAPTLSEPAASCQARPRKLQGSLSINMKYRRRILKILFTYLMTSIVCWTPLQFSIIYRHFRSEAVPARWFFELVFFSQLSASLSAAMNPVIFGFLSQPFRKIVTKTLLFRLLRKVCSANKNTAETAKNEQNENNNNNNFQLCERQNVAAPCANSSRHSNRAPARRTSSAARHLQQVNKLAIDKHQQPTRVTPTTRRSASNVSKLSAGSLRRNGAAGDKSPDCNNNSNNRLERQSLNGKRQVAFNTRTKSVCLFPTNEAGHENAAYLDEAENVGGDGGGDDEATQRDLRL